MIPIDPDDTTGEQARDVLRNTAHVLLAMAELDQAVELPGNGLGAGTVATRHNTDVMVRDLSDRLHRVLYSNTPTLLIDSVVPHVVRETLFADYIVRMGRGDLE